MASVVTHDVSFAAGFPRIRIRPGNLLSILFLLAGAGLLLHGLWIPTKAQLAQILLNHSWQRALAGEEKPLPWGWADTWPIARIRIPETGQSFVVLEGTSGESMAFGPGHMAGTAMPGERGNSVISAHRDTQFARLGELYRGNEIVVERADGEIVSYRVERQLIVHESDLSVIREEGDTRLTLLTCYPFDGLAPGTPYRFALIAKRVGREPRTEGGV